MRSIDYKMVAWCRLHLPDSVDIEEVKKKLEEGIDPLDIAYEDGILQSKKAYEQIDWEFLEETEELLTLEENCGSSTIEIIQDDEIIWQNGKE
jgi:hypothetical protein